VIKCELLFSIAISYDNNFLYILFFQTNVILS